MVITYDRGVTITLGNLSQDYNGQARTVTATPSISGVSVSVTYDGSSTAPSNAGSYSVLATVTSAGYQGSASGTLTISKPALTITANNASKTYGNAVTYGSGQTAFSVSGLQNGETIGSITLTASGGTAATASAGTYTLTPSAATGGTFTAANYSITYTTGTLTVNPAALTITANNVSKTYGTAVTYGSGQTGFATSGLKNSEAIGSVTLTANGGTAATASAGTYTLTPSAATGGTFTAANYSITYTTGTLTVNPAALTITANNVSKTYGTSFTAVGAGQTAFATSSLQNSETIGSVTLTASGGTAATASAGTYTLTPSAATGGTFTASNYSITYTDGILTVNPAALTITANNASKTYGTSFAAVGAGQTTFSTSGLQNSETIGSVTLTASGGTAATATAGTYSLTPSAATGGTFTTSNYSITYTAGILTVNPAALTITANNASKTYGAAVTYGAGQTGFTTSGLQNSETIGSITLTASGGTASTANPATYTLTPSGAIGGTFSAANYSITYIAGTLTVNPAVLTITADNASKTYGTSFTAVGSGQTSFSTSGLQNGESVGSVTVTASGGTGATAGAGTYTLTPSAATGGTFAAVNYSITYTDGTLTVTPAALTITANNASKTYGTSFTAVGAGQTTFSTSGLQNSETVGSVTLLASGGTAATASAGTYALTPSAATGGSFTAANYSITYTAGTLTVNPAALTITANNASKTYGTVVTYGAGQAGFTTVGLQNNETVGSVTLTANGGAATAGTGTYALTPSTATGGTFAAANYSIAYIAGTLTVTPAALTLTANDASKTYGTAFTAVGAGQTAFATSGLQNNETIGSVTLTASGGTAATAGVGTYALTPSDASGGTFAIANYSITYAPGTLTVNPAALTLTANDASKTYGTAFTAVGSGQTAFATSGLQNNETVGSVTLTASGGTAATAGAGSYALTPSAAAGGTFAAANYSITYTAGILTVNAAALTITANNASKTYGTTLTYGSGQMGFTSSGLQNGETVGSVTLTANGGAATAGAGTYTLTPSVATGGTFTAANYSITYTAGTLTVSPAALAVIADDVSKPYGDALTAVGSGQTHFTASGLKNGEAIGSVTLAATGVSDATAGVGTYALVPSLATGGTFDPANYQTTYVPGMLTVTRAPLTITADAASKSYGSAFTAVGSGQGGFTPTGLKNGETIGSVTLTASGGTTATAAPGTYTLTPSAATGGTYSPGNYTLSYVAGVLTVTPAALTVTAHDATKAYGTPFTAVGVGKTTFTASGLRNNETIGSVTITANGGTATSAAAGAYALTPANATGGSFKSGNYAITYVPGTLTVTPRPLVFSGSRPYDGTPTVDGAILAVDNSLDGSAVYLSGQLTLDQKHVGQRTITSLAGLSISGTARANYTLSGASGSVTVLQTNIIVTADYNAKDYDGTTTATARPRVTSGLVQPGDTAQWSEAYGSADAGAGRTLIPSGSVSDGNQGQNYAYTFVNIQTGVIRPRTIRVDAFSANTSSSSKIYDGTTVAQVTDIAPLAGIQIHAEDFLEADRDALGSNTVGFGDFNTAAPYFATSRPGTALPILLPCNRALTGDGSGNYKFAAWIGSADILNTLPGGNHVLSQSTPESVDLKVDKGALVVQNDPTSGSINGNGTVEVSDGARLAGTGKVGDLVLKKDGILSPGNSPGNLSSGDATWEPGSVYDWEINDARGTAGTSPGWDLAAIEGNLTITATSENKHVIRITSLTLGNIPGSAANFNNARAFGWPIATVTGSIIGFDASKFSIDTTDFQNGYTGSGSFQVRPYGKSLYLVYLPNTIAFLDPPAVAINYSLDGKPRGATITFTNISGLRYGGVSSMRNVTVTCQPYNEAGTPIGAALTLGTSAKTELPPGTVEARTVATKVDNAVSGSVNGFVENEAGQLRSTDPVLARIQLDDAGRNRLVLVEVPVQERYWSLVNGSSGVEEIEVRVNGRLVLQQSLAPDETATGEFESAAEWGDFYQVEILARGRPRASASWVLAEFPLTAANLVPVPPKLELRSTPQGLWLSWSDPTGSWRLQQGDALGRSWVDVPTTDAAPSTRTEIRVETRASSGFFRLRARD